LFKVCSSIFPVLERLMGQMISNKDNVEAMHMLHMICKIFFKTNRLRVVPYLMGEDILDPWIRHFKTILDWPAPPEHQDLTEDADEIAKRDKHIFWKVKGTTAKAAYWMFTKYNDP